MNTEDFNEEVRRERIESDAAARTLEDEIEDRESDIRDLHASLEDYVQRLARATEALTSLRVRLRDADARNKALEERVEALHNSETLLSNLFDGLVAARDADIDDFVRLRAEHDAGKIMRAVPDTRSPEFIDAYRPWADAHDRTELAK